jgi:hypothetical protein
MWIWRYENPHAVVQYIYDSLNINVWCGLTHDEIIGLLYFFEETVTLQVYVDMVQLFVAPQMDHLQPLIFQQDFTPLHWS